VGQTLLSERARQTGSVTDRAQANQGPAGTLDILPSLVCMEVSRVYICVFFMVGSPHAGNLYKALKGMVSSLHAGILHKLMKGVLGC